MFNTLKKRIKNEKGLSLVELLAVIVILAIVAAIAIPAIGNIIANSKAKSEISDAIQILNSAKLYEVDGNEFPAAGLDSETDKEKLKDYVEYTDRIKKFTVEKASDEYVITFSGKQLGDNKGPYSLSDLSALEISKGEIATTTP